MRIDINGDKKPNSLGRDIFIFLYYVKSTNSALEGKLVAEGMQHTRNYIITNSCTKTSAGNCAALIMKDGWRIADDFPW